MGGACPKRKMRPSTADRDVNVADSSEHWYALKVWTRSEALASEALRNRGFETFSPTYQERRRFVDRVKTVNIPAFPGYIFCYFVLHAKIPVLSSPAVEYIVGVRGRPTPIANTEIDAIRRYLAAGSRPVPYLQVGQKVTINYGPLTGFEGILTRVDGQDRLTLSIDLLQRSLALQIDADRVRPSSSAA